MRAKSPNQRCPALWYPIAEGVIGTFKVNHSERRMYRFLSAADEG